MLHLHRMISFIQDVCYAEETLIIKGKCLCRYTNYIAMTKNISHKMDTFHNGGLYYPYNCYPFSTAKTLNLVPRSILN